MTLQLAGDLLRVHGVYCTACALSLQRLPRSPALLVFAHMVPLAILVVDDDDMSRELFRLLLGREGYHATTATSGDDALRIVGEGFVPDVVLADLQMPGLPSCELAQRLRTGASPSSVLLAMSGSEPLPGATDGFDHFLLKPFTMDALSDAINRCSAVSSVIDSAHEAPPSALNEAIYSRLQAAMNGEKLSQLYTICLDDVLRRVAVMNAAANDADDAAYRREAHAIKGGCGMVGATQLQTIASTEENRGIPANHVASLDEIIRAAEVLKGMLVARQIIKTNSIR